MEAIVKQRDREATAASIARLTESSGKPRPEAIEPEVRSVETSTNKSLVRLLFVLTIASKFIILLMKTTTVFYNF